MDSLLHSDLSFLSELRNYTFESKMIVCQLEASKIMNGSEVDLKMAAKLHVTPWELEAFTLFSIVYDDEKATNKLDNATFGEIITKIRNFWHPELDIAEKNGTISEILGMIMLLQQSPVQGLNLQRLFRYNYIFNFQNEKVDFKAKFVEKYSVTYDQYEEFAFALFLLCSRAENIPRWCYEKPDYLMKVYQRKDVVEHLSIEKEVYKKELTSFYKGKILDFYYGLKLQYIWPIVEFGGYYYTPSPYLVINSVTESMLNQLTEGDEKLRGDLGKEVLESYLHDIVNELPSKTWISKEKEYFVDGNRCLTSDVLLSEGEYMTFYDTKSLVPSTKLRQFNRKEIDHNIEMYADAIVEIYNQIRHCQQGLFGLDKLYDKNKVFGVAVVLEDSFVSRQRMYEKAFEVIKENGIMLDEIEEAYIKSHIKLVALRQIEAMVLQNTSFLKCLLDQVNENDKWEDLNYVIPTLENGLLKSYEKYADDLKRRVGKWLQ